MNNDLTDFGNEYVEEEAMNKYGVEFEFLSNEAQDELWLEAQREYEEHLSCESDYLRDRLKDEFIETQNESLSEIRRGL